MKEKEIIDGVWERSIGFRKQKPVLQQAFLEIILCCCNQQVYAYNSNDAFKLSRIVLNLKEELAILNKSTPSIEKEHPK